MDLITLDNIPTINVVDCKLNVCSLAEHVHIRYNCMTSVLKYFEYFQMKL